MSSINGKTARSRAGMARVAYPARLERQIDPDGLLSPEERVWRVWKAQQAMARSEGKSAQRRVAAGAR